MRLQPKQCVNAPSNLKGRPAVVLVRQLRSCPSERGVSAVGILAVLTFVGVLAAALLQLAPLNLRAARREQERIRALGYAESGVAYAIAWPQANDFDHTSWTDGTHVSLPDESGGFRDVTISLNPSGNYEVEATGYVEGAGREIGRRVQVVVNVVPQSQHPLFPWHLVNMRDVFDVNYGNPTDEDHPLYGYWLDPALDIGVPDRSAWPSADPGAGIVQYAGPLMGSFHDEQIFLIGDDLTVTGNAVFHRPTTLYIDGDLVIDGGSLDFRAGGAIFVTGNVTIIGDAGVTGASGPNDWIVFYVGGTLQIGTPSPSRGTPNIGADVPNGARTADELLRD